MPQASLKTSSKQASMTKGAVGKSLFKLTIPMFFGMLAIIGFNLTDTYFVAQLGTNQLAAISFTFPVVMLIGGIAHGMGLSVSILVSRAIGEKNSNKVNRTTTDALLLAVLLVAIFAIFGLLTIDVLFQKLGANDEILPFIKEYMQIWYLGIPFVIIPMVGNHAIRATGDMKTPGMIMVLSAFLNLALDPLLIFGLLGFPKLGLQGAAIATIIARFIAMSVSLYILYFREKMIKLDFSCIKEIYHSWKELLHIGIPASANFIIIPIAAGVITKIVSNFGAKAVAAMGTGSRIDAFAMIVIMALGAVLMPFIGQNIGAKKIKRAIEAHNKSQIFAQIYGLFNALILYFLAPIIAKEFSNDDEVISYIILYLRIIPIGYGLYASTRIAGLAFNAIKKPLKSSFLCVVQVLIMQITFVYIGASYLGVKGAFVGIVLANIFSGIIGFVWIYFELKKEEQ